MLLNELPDDCLLTIFNLVGDLENLINCTKVCSRWSLLLFYRLRNVQYALKSCTTDAPKSTVYMENGSIINEIKANELLPNLKIIEISRESVDGDLQKFARTNKSVIGLIYPFIKDNLVDFKSLARHFPILEIIVSDWMDAIFDNREVGLRMKQMCLKRAHVNLIAEIASNLENLERLHVDDDEYSLFFSLTGLNRNLYECPIIPNLKILEIAYTPYGVNDDYIAFSFMDHCPSLQSAFFYSGTPNYNFNESIVNENLKDLVLEYLDPNYSQNWTSLKSFFLKFPNLENLAIRKSDEISDENIKELVNILPKVKLLDFRYSPKVTSRSADYIRDYCVKSDRNIVIYYTCEDNEPESWPKMDANNHDIVTGFEFMTHCFFKRFRCLPMILFPVQE